MSVYTIADQSVCHMRLASGEHFHTGAFSDILKVLLWVVRFVPYEAHASDSDVENICAILNQLLSVAL